MDLPDELWRETLEALPSEIALLDSNGALLFTNQAWRDFGSQNGLVSGFFVEDDGPGIPEDVFKSGYSTSTDGTGFGLAIIEQIVEAHGWQITVTDGGAGARFEITV